MTDDAPAHDALEGFPLSPQQRRAWARGLEATTELRLSVTGASDSAIRDALAGLVGTLEILRTTFPKLSGMSAPLQSIQERAEVTWENGSSEDGSGVRARLEPGEGGETTLVLTLSTLQADAASAEPVARALQDALRGAEPEQDPLQYADLADWLNETLAGEAAESGRAFWRDQYANAPIVGVPFGSATEAPDASRVAIDVPLADGVGTAAVALAKRLGVSTAAVALALWGELLRRRSPYSPVESDAVAVGVAFDGRAYDELADAVGPLTRVAPLAVPIGKVSLEDTVRLVQAALEEGASWQDTFDPESDLAAPPAGFSWSERRPAASVPGPRVAVERVSAPPAGVAELSVTVSEGDLDVCLVTTLQHAAAAERLAGQLAVLFGAALDTPEAPLSRHAVLTDADRDTLDAFSASTHPPSSEHDTLHALVEAQVARSPNATAVTGPDGELSYADLDARANRLARHLQSLGVESGARVAVVLGRTIDAVVAILATLKAGGAYLPVDPAYPADRVAFMLSDAEVRAVVTQSEHLDLLTDTDVPLVALDRDAKAVTAQSDAPLENTVEADAAAYVLYTSGSTGRPKGVVVEHRQATFSTAARRAVYAEPIGAYLLLPSFAFDSSVAGLFWTLSTGGTLVVPSAAEAADPRALAAAIEAHRVTHVLGVPSLVGHLVDHAARLGSLQTCIVAGEACPPGLADRYAERLPGVHLFNEYGPTETTVWATVYDLAGWPSDRDRTATVPIGRPIPGARVFLLDPSGQRVPVGSPGEIVVGGPGVAREYLGQPDLTAERFVEGPDGERAYRTGDLGRFLSDGTLVFLGRSDDQIKLRGYRIELAEIEAVLSEHAGISEAAVALREDAGGGPRLVAAVVPDAQTAGAAIAGGPARYQLPNGLWVAHQNPAETDYTYAEIFEDQSYFRHGIALSEGAVVFDVGANIGLFSLLVSLSVPDAQVFAFEPIPETFQALRTNAALAGAAIRPFELALSQTAGETEFSYFPHVSLVSGRYADGADERQAVRAFLRQSPGDGAAVADDALDALLDVRLERRPVRVQMRTVSDVIRDQGVDRIDLLKIDVEKSEVDVLEGIEADDWSKVRQVTMEVQDTDAALDRVREILGGQGFHVAVEQETELDGTPLVKVYATRDAGADSTRLVPTLPAWSDAGALAADLTAHAERQLPEYMVPSAVVVVPQLPRTPNGKLDRDALPEAPAPTSGAVPHRAPSTDTEIRLARVWAAALGLDRIGADEDFFELGGHSILAIKLFARIESEFGAAPPLATLFSAPTVALLAAEIEAVAPAEASPNGILGSALVPLQPLGHRPPLFCFHNAHNEIFLYADLAHALGSDRPVYHVQGQGHDGREITHTDLGEMADEYLEQMRALQPRGPYFLAGFCIGGRLALEVGRRLLAAGERIGLLAVIESPLTDQPLPPRRKKYAHVARRLTTREGLRAFDPRDVGRWVMTGAARWGEKGVGRIGPEIAREFLERGARVPTPLRVHYILDTYFDILYASDIAPYPGDVLLIRSPSSDDFHADWEALTEGTFEEVSVDGSRLLSEPKVDEVADVLRRRMEAGA